MKGIACVIQLASIVKLLWMWQCTSSVKCLNHSSEKNWASLVAHEVQNPHTVQETWVRSLGREDSLENEMLPNPVFLPEKSHGQRSLAG